MTASPVVRGVLLPYSSFWVRAFKAGLAEALPGDAFWRAFTGRLATAYLNVVTMEVRGGHAQGGAWRPKTQKHRQVDEEVFVALAWVAADHPLAPLGVTEVAVRGACKELWGQACG